MNFQYEIAQNSVTMSVNFFTELHKCEHKNESDQALNNPLNNAELSSLILKTLISGHRRKFRPKSVSDGAQQNKSVC